MITSSEHFFLSSDGETNIHVNTWIPADSEIRGVIQIAHGVAEYAQRYHAFAEFLCENGFAVVANDHLGHGKSLIADSPMVYMGEKDGWWHTVDDMEKLRVETKDQFPDKPYILFGHSMGSFLSRTHMIRYPGAFDGYILCGTGNQSPMIIAGGKLVANLEIKRLGKKAFSRLADKMAFAPYNKKFAPNRTGFDWLSVNEANVDAYIADPLCGGETKLGLFRELLEGMGYVTKMSNIEKMDKSKPVFFISGEKDPVGDMGKGVKKAFGDVKKAGISDAEIKLYKGMRHEILNETDRESVYRDILEWLTKHFG